MIMSGDGETVLLSPDGSGSFLLVLGDGEVFLGNRGSGAILCVSKGSDLLRVSEEGDILL